MDNLYEYEYKYKNEEWKQVHSIINRSSWDPIDLNGGIGASS